MPRAADGYIPLEHFEKLIDEETLLVAVTQVCFRNGARLDIPGIVAFLASDEAAFITGQVISVSGGLTMAG